MILDIAKYTNSGGHQINEDSIYCGSDLFIVADGLGGHYGGENASAAAVSYISESYRGDISDSAIEQLVQGANDAVNKLNDDSHTTLAAAFISGERIRVANVGDSRVYIFRKNKVLSVTKDHSVCQVAVDMGEMSYEDIRFSDDRSRLLKVLGGEAALNFKAKYEPIELYDGDAFLLCSDGFWEYVHEREMEADLIKADSAESWKRFMLKRHLLKAKNEGDNYSLICGIVHSERKLISTPIPNTVAVKSTAPEPVIIEETQAPKNRSGLIIALIALLLIAAVAAFWFLGGSELFGGTSGTSGDISDISTAETSETETIETTESMPDETEELSISTSEAPDESEEQPPTPPSDTPDESEEQPPVTTSEVTEATTSEPVEPSETDELLPEDTEEIPSTSVDTPENVPPERVPPLQPGLPPFMAF